MGQGQWYHPFSPVRLWLYSLKFPGPPLIHTAVRHVSRGKGQLYISANLRRKDSNDYSALQTCAVWRRGTEIMKRA